MTTETPCMKQAPGGLNMYHKLYIQNLSACLEGSTLCYRKLCFNPTWQRAAHLH